MHESMKRTLVQIILAMVFGATLVSAEIFTFPRYGTQLEPAKTVNATWRADILDRLLNANVAVTFGGTTTSGVGGSSASSTFSASSSAVFSSTTTVPFLKRQDTASSRGLQSSDSIVSSTATGTNTSSSPTILDTSSTMSAASSTTSTDTAASPTGMPTTHGANVTTPRCVSGMPTNTSDEDGSIQLCSTLELVSGESHEGTPLFLTTNFNVSADWMEVRVPYVTPGDGYRLRMTIADGMGEDAFLSAPFSILPM
ncbi:hypothetical protein C8Q79DRAFT_1118555 [Trametes meyenii]|nr:hypothetical protein C8Q79DRAFT_1118555 [Trametes meyenii]